MKYWLFKTEPSVFSIADLARGGVECWDGIRNYQARNFLRDQTAIGDRVLIYHSRDQPIGIAGEAEICSAPYPDPSQFDPASKYFDAKAKPQNPPWVQVEVRYLRTYPRVITLAELKTTPGLEAMLVNRRGQRLSIQPVQPHEWEIVSQLADSPDLA